jgi:hypothetical protein
VPPGVRTILYDLNEVDRWLAAGRVETIDSLQPVQNKTAECAA